MPQFHHLCCVSASVHMRAWAHSGLDLTPELCMMYWIICYHVVKNKLCLMHNLKNAPLFVLAIADQLNSRHWGKVQIAG